MKKISALILTFLLLFSGCAFTVEKVDNSKTQTTQNETSTVSETTTENQTEKITEKESEKVFTTKENKTMSETSETTTEKLPACTIYIECRTIFDNMENLKVSKKEFLPEDGIILRETEVSFSEGETVFEVFKRVCKEKGIQMESSYTPGYDNYYIEGISQIYEKDCGTKSGWMYSVNGIFPNFGCSDYEVKDGDKIELRYTCNLGADIGDNSFNN